MRPCGSPSVTVGLCLGALPVAKGALVGLQWALRLHGFGGAGDDIEAHPALPAAAPAVLARRA